MMMKKLGYVAALSIALVSQISASHELLSGDGDSFDIFKKPTINNPADLSNAPTTAPTPKPSSSPSAMSNSPSEVSSSPAPSISPSSSPQSQETPSISPPGQGDSALVPTQGSPSIAGKDDSPSAVSATNPSASPPSQNCEVSNGTVGKTTSTTRTVKYFYRMKYTAGSVETSLMESVEDAITTLAVKSTRISGCSTTRARRQIQENSIAGISSAPEDKLNSSCGDTCIVVEGRLTLYLASDKRQLSSADDYESEILKTTKNAMTDGSLSSANKNITSLEYLSPGDSVIVSDKVDQSTKEDTESDNVAVSSNIPKYMFAFLGLGATVCSAIAAYSIRRRMACCRGGEFDEEAHQHRGFPENLNDSSSFSYLPRDKEGNVSLYDDGSSNFLDMSGATGSRMMMSWKSNSYLDESSSFNDDSTTTSNVNRKLAYEIS